MTICSELNDDGTCPTCGALDPLRATPSAISPSIYWLIERGSPAEWWAGSGAWVDGLWHPTEQQPWTQEASKALKFRTREAAQMEADRIWGLPMVGTPALRVTDHMDLSAQSTVAAHMPSRERLREKIAADPDLPAEVAAPLEGETPIHNPDEVVLMLNDSDSIGRALPLCIAVECIEQLKRQLSALQTETMAWLIERHINDRHEYFAGWRNCARVFNPAEPFWSFDPHEATRFCRQRDAEVVVKMEGWFFETKIIEHLFIGDRAPPSSTTAAGTPIVECPECNIRFGRSSKT